MLQQWCESFEVSRHLFTLHLGTGTCSSVLVGTDYFAVANKYVGRFRLREVESGRDTALYEARRAAERRSAAEAWRLKELHRAET